VQKKRNLNNHLYKLYNKKQKMIDDRPAITNFDLNNQKKRRFLKTKINFEIGKRDLKTLKRIDNYILQMSLS